MTIKTSTDLISQYAHTQTTDDVDYCFRTRVARFVLPADAAASTATDNYLFTGIKACKLVSARVLPSAAVTADDTNYATLALGPYTLSSGAIGTAYDSILTKITGGTGNWTAGVAEDFTIVTATDVCAVTQGIALKVTKAGTGVALPRLTVEIEYRLD